MPFRRGSFWFKLALIVGAVAVADYAIWATVGVGANLGLIALTWVLALALGNPSVVRDRLGRLAIAGAAVFALLQFERPTLVGLLLYVVAMGVAALAPRAPRGEDAWRWFQRLAAGAVIPIAGAYFDLARLNRARTRARSVRVAAIAAALAVPLVGAGIFVSLFVAANPVIAEILGGWEPRPIDFGRLFVWGVLAYPLWVVLRPRGLRRTWRAPGLDRDLGAGSFAAPASIAASLALFNLIFAIQNGLDLAYLWAGAGLPDGMSLSAYAHRGAEPLIATAILAALFVLVFLRPGSATAASRPIRILVTVWVAQNLFLVASTALRTIDYVEAYSLTNMRIAALIWMGLVAVGLVLVLWRLLRGRSASWLINANVTALALVLAVCSVVDFSSVAAAWNVRHAREAGGGGVALDLCYFGRLGGAGAVALAELEQRPLSAELRDRVVWKRRQLTFEMANAPGSWRGWRWRDQRRVERIRKLTGEPPPSVLAPERRGCDGRPLPPRRSPPDPLTPSPNAGT